jgi:hypothetical protein
MGKRMMIERTSKEMEKEYRREEGRRLRYKRDEGNEREI